MSDAGWFAYDIWSAPREPIDDEEPETTSEEEQ